MGQEALEAAIAFYRSGGRKNAPPVKEGVVVCTCFNVTDKEIERAIIDNKLKTVEDVTNFTKAGGGCGGCHEQIQEMLDTINGPGTPSGAKPAARLTTLQKIDRIRTVISSDIRPILAKDGGDCELVDVDGDEVTIRFKGHCNGCAFSNMTLVSVVQKKLREKVADTLIVTMIE
jgi:NifU-like protein